MSDFSDHGECIDSAIDKIDSEIIGALVAEQLQKLPEEQKRMLMMYYGYCFFKKKMKMNEIATIEGVTRRTIYSRIRRAVYFILRPGTRLRVYILEDSFYRSMLDKSAVYKIKKEESKTEKRICKTTEENFIEPHYSEDPKLRRFYEALARLKNRTKN